MSCSVSGSLVNVLGIPALTVELGMTGAVDPAAAHEVAQQLPLAIAVHRVNDLPDELEVVARTSEAGFEDEIQAVRHRTHPVWGVQFHPESILTQHGKDLIANFLELAGLAPRVRVRQRLRRPVLHLQRFQARLQRGDLDAARLVELRVPEVASGDQHHGRQQHLLSVRIHGQSPLLITMTGRVSIADESGLSYRASRLNL